MQIRPLIFLASALAHIEMREPAPRRSKYIPENIRTQVTDYAQNSPLGIYPCKGYQERGPVVKTYYANNAIHVELEGSANHNGGNCEFSLSYNNGKTFFVVHTILGTCLQGGDRVYSIPLGNVPASSSALFAWTWINTTGDREFYMNCADVKIINPQGRGTISGPRPVVANLPECAVKAKNLRLLWNNRGCPFKNVDCPLIEEFTGLPHCNGAEMYTSRKRFRFSA